MTKDEVFPYLCKQANYALNSRDIELMYEAYGMAKMALKLDAITMEHFNDLKTKIVKNGINNPRRYDD